MSLPLSGVLFKELQNRIYYPVWINLPPSALPGIGARYAGFPGNPHFPGNSPDSFVREGGKHAAGGTPVASREGAARLDVVWYNLSVTKANGVGHIPNVMSKTRTITIDSSIE